MVQSFNTILTWKNSKVLNKKKKTSYLEQDASFGAQPAAVQRRRGDATNEPLVS